MLALTRECNIHSADHRVVGIGGDEDARGQGVHGWK
jgi:hypothetical protein